jgi:hypothetical protein
LISQITFAPDGTLYLTNVGFGSGDGTIERYNPDGSVGGVFYAGVFAGWGLEISPFDGTVWVGNTNDFSGAPKILTFSPEGTLISQFGSYPQLVQNAGMAFYNPPGNTPPGSDVAITPPVILPNGDPALVALTFDNVDASGETSVTTASVGPPPPSGFKLTSPPVYYQITTTAAFSGNIRVCLSWTEGQVANESKVNLFHHENGFWINITDTASRNAVTNTVCGTTSSLSPFALFDLKYQFSGFFSPVDSEPTVNSVKAGSSVPVKFSLGGDQGLSIFAGGYPRVQQTQCVTGAPIDAIEETVTAGENSLTYDVASGRYIYVWKTEKAWAGSCRLLQVRLADGELYTARFTMSK